MSNTKTIARNSGWYGLESAINATVALLTSIMIARALGPTKNGYIIYVNYIASVVSGLGGVGIPATTRKYMAEFLGMGDRGTARYIYLRTLMLQAAFATVATTGLAIWILHDANDEYRAAALLIVLSIWPAMVNAISAHANIAMEQLSRNFPASVLSTLIFFCGIGATVVFHWSVLGVGASIFTMRAVDFLVRIFLTAKHTLAWESAHIQPPGLYRRMTIFAWQSVASMIAALIVWERSEVLLLKSLCPDIRQVSFYSVAFSMAERLLIGSSIFGSATGATIFAQFGRDKSRLPLIAASTFRYLVLAAIPLHIVAAALAKPALLLLFGHEYAGAAMAATLAPLLCMPKAFMSPAQSLLQSNERQSYIIGATILAGIVDIGVAWSLIPSLGAVGACLGSGAAQVTAVGLMWAICIKLYKVKLPWRMAAKIVLISLAAALTAHLVAVRFSPVWGILLGGGASLAVFVSSLYAMRVLERNDGERMQVVFKLLPRCIGEPACAFTSLLIRPVSSAE
jgi:O-antigen/teichoic acid export membrane protein